MLASIEATNTVRCVVFGSGGHARVVIETLLAENHAIPFAILDPDKRLWGTTVLDVPVLGGDDLVDALMQKESVTHFAIGVGSVGNPAARIRLFNFAISRHLQPVTVTHPSAAISPTAIIGSGSQILSGAIVSTGSRIGKNVIVNSGAIVDHDCFIADHAHIATGARLCGGVVVEEASHIGAGATVLQCVKIGRSCVVGAGAVVTRDVTKGATVVGVPASPIARRT